MRKVTNLRVKICLSLLRLGRDDKEKVEYIPRAAPPSGLPRFHATELMSVISLSISFSQLDRSVPTPVTKMGLTFSSHYEAIEMHFC